MDGRLSIDLDGAAFSARGVNTLLFVRTADCWRISAVAWEDDHADLLAPEVLG